MPWKEKSAMTMRKEFVELALQEGSNRRELMRRYSVSPTTGYKWLRRYKESGEGGLVDLSRRPHRFPLRTAATIEEVVVEVRDRNPAWGGRKIRKRLVNLGHKEVPAPSTITAIVRRSGRAVGELSAPSTPWKRFEAEAPNALWQMDFKGHFSLRSGRCHPLTVLDDHSRFSVGLRACGDERTTTVEQELEAIFDRYGMPERLLTDNGPPWGSSGRESYTKLTVWLIRLGIGIRHGRPHHPQTQGKDERFHRTLNAEVLRDQTFTDLAQTQRRFDHWRNVYNCERPHQALDLETPISRYQVSTRRFPSSLPPIEYGPDDKVRKVQWNGEIYFKGRDYHVGRAFHGLPVGLRPTAVDGQLEVFFCYQRVARIDLRDPR
jgi:transposase InsO family protein